MGDFVNLGAAILGGAVGLFLVFRLDLFRGHGEERDPVPAEATRRTGYVSTHPPSAAPILTALGAAVLGVGLALGSGLGGFGVVLLVPGVTLLTAALVTAIRRRSSRQDDPWRLRQ